MIESTPEEVKTNMVHSSVIEARLSKLGFKTSRWFKPEIKELQHILMDNEQLVGAVAGRYFGGFALLIATERRLLLIDKKIPYLSVEDIRYDMISEIDYNSRMFDSTINIYTVNKQHRFNSWKHRDKLRALVNYAQKRVMEMRQYQNDGYQEAPVYSHNPPSMIQSYNYGQTLQLQPPVMQPEIRKRLPSPHMPRIVGAAAVNGARRWVHPPNPYTQGSLVMRNQYRSN
jgi:hypothetical protein